MDKRLMVISGGANGIGKEVAKAFAHNRYIVITMDKEKQDWEHDQVHAIQVDVTDHEQLQSAIDGIHQQYGSPSVLINNAGVSTFKPFFDLTLNDWNHVLKTNLTSAFLLSQGFAKTMKQRKESCSIINISSTRAFMSEANSEAYAASKGGITALTHAMAMSLQDTQITVNAIAPGWIHTGDIKQLRDIDHTQHPSNRVGTPRDIAEACLFLAHPNNNFINGETLTIDGGMTRKMIYAHDE
ncbi:SDR family NAD(P)-dependent oxidoreductase [Shouchella lehensis]|uniref:Oxidoreductase n=1 Tax=Shouchella lehensis G1 TaxID=1246626 RepID=A0A060M459_9BACI|nr:SDR family oxidoreductase [Shouchella lehensis]AIC95338.1 oxidoreductase [Shouchella lehensis G1]